jgi:hypothetical protein
MGEEGKCGRYDFKYLLHRSPSQLHAPWLVVRWWLSVLSLILLAEREKKRNIVKMLAKVRTSRLAHH